MGLRLMVVRTALVVLACTVAVLVWRGWDDCLMWAASAGRTSLVRVFLIRNSSVNARNGRGYTPLMAAAWSGHPDVAELLVRHGADLEATDEDQNTALIWAAWEGQVGVADFLIHKGASLNHQNRVGNTAIISAMINGYPNAVRLLLDAGADINLTNKDGDTVLIRAGQRGYGDLVRLFSQHGAIQTNVFIGRSRYPVKPLPPARLWALATTALLVQYNGDSFELLGSRPAGDQAWAKNLLGDWWGIHNRGQAIRILDWLRDSGHREKYQAADKRPRQKGSSQVRYLAWDYCRLVWVAGVSYVAG